MSYLHPLHLWRESAWEGSIDRMRDVVPSLGVATYYHPSDFEVASGWVHGRVTPPGPDACRGGARRAIERVILRSLQRSPCYVAFSGGRDSSAILAVATQLARTHGLPDPVPITELYPGIPESDESTWQTLVIEHLQLKDWQRVTIEESADLLGPVARASVLRRGNLWPPALHIKATLLTCLHRGSSLLTGEGGDEVLGRRRGAQVSRLWRRSRAPGVSDLRSAGASLLPATARARRLAVRLESAAMQPWLTPEVRQHHYAMMAGDLASEPLKTSSSIRWLLTRRGAAMASHNYALMCKDYDVTLYEPLLDPTFVYAFAGEAGRWGFSSRTDAMRHLFSDVLPEPVIARRSKAYFNRAFIGPHSRDFALSWNGGGVDQAMVDVEMLRSEWLAPFPSAISTSLIHTAWLGSRASSSVEAS